MDKMVCDRIRSEDKQLTALPKAEIVEIYKRTHKICDVRGVSKFEMLNDILIARHGSAAVAAAFATS